VANGDHADEMETSLMLHVFPELVLPLEDAGDGASKKIKLKAIQEKWAWAPREWSKVTSDTGIGNPKAATAERGERYSRFITEEIAQYFCELSEINLSDMYE
jgi:creatinine amidohydrolase